MKKPRKETISYQHSLAVRRARYAAARRGEPEAMAWVEKMREAAKRSRAKKPEYYQAYEQQRLEKIKQERLLARLGNPEARQRRDAALERQRIRRTIKARAAGVRPMQEFLAARKAAANTPERIAEKKAYASAWQRGYKARRKAANDAPSNS